MKTQCFLTIGIISLTLAVPALAETVGWRMDGDGRYTDANPPVSWSPEKNVIWKTPLSEFSNASPVLLEEKSMVFVLNEPDEIVAVHSKDGKILWKDSTKDVTGEKLSAHQANGWTTPTPVSDGSHVFAVFGSGVVAAYTVDGKRVWARKVQEPTHRWGLSASPVLAGGHLIVQVVDLIALDPKTGKEVWREESEAKWGTPIATEIDGTEVLITPDGDVFQAKSGARVAAGIGKLQFAAPVVQDGVVYFIEKKATAVRLPKKLDQPFEELWVSRIQGSRHYASVVIHEGLIYAVSREEFFAILDAKTGELLHESKLDIGGGTNSAYPSITLAGDKLFLSTENGTTVVLKPSKKYEELARNNIEGFRSSPVFIGDRMYVRAFDYLYCFGSKG